MGLAIYYFLLWVVFRFGEDQDADPETEKIGASFTNVIYFGTVLMSTVGYGDLNPTGNGFMRMATVLFAIVGIAVIFSRIVLLISRFALSPLLNVLSECATQGL